MTDNEIIKALECCGENNCGECPYYSQHPCQYILNEECLDLINRQKAEIERLQRLLDEADKKYNLCAKRFYKEGVKEFAERLKENAFQGCYVISKGNLNNLVKEMTGDGVKCIDCEYLELSLPYGVCLKEYKMVNPDDSCGKGKLKNDHCS